MKSILKYLTIYFVLNSATANAAWTSSTIDHIQMSSTAGLVYIFLNDPVTFDNCSNTQTASRLIIRQAPTNGPANNFEEIYAQLLIYQQSSKPITVLSSAGTCSGTSAPYIDGPYIRFE